VFSAFTASKCFVIFSASVFLLAASAALLPKFILPFFSFFSFSLFVSLSLYIGAFRSGAFRSGAFRSGAFRTVGKDEKK